MDLMSFVGGCLGGFAGIISSYPFDTIKVRIQNQHVSNEKYRGAFDCLIRTIKKESTSALYKGVSSPLVGSMFINALLFGVENNTRKRLNIDENVAEGQPRPYHLYAVSGAVAGLAQSFLLSPVELIKIKMQIPDSGYTSTWQCTRDLISHHREFESHERRMADTALRKHRRAFAVLTRGTWLTVMRDVPGVAAYFVGFEYMCDCIRARSNQPVGSSGDNLSVTSLLAAGGLAGCLSWVVTYPVDVIKTRYQADFSYRSVSECLRKSLANEGHMMLWRGLSPTLLRAFPNNAAVFATVTLFNRFVNQWQSADSDNYDEKSSSSNYVESFTPSRLQTEFLLDTYDMHR